MKIGFYDPYLDTMGGGERYFLEAARYFQKKDHQVIFFWNNNHDQKLISDAKDRFNIDFTRFHITPDVFSSKSSLMSKIMSTKSFDVLFYLSDGSFPFLFAKRNILMFQHPVDWVKIGLLTEYKLSFIYKILCNSYFVKDHIDQTFGTEKNVVIYPPVINAKREHIKREKMILSVGRFSNGMNAKKHDELIDAFKHIYEEHKDWKLILAGGIREEDKIAVSELQKKAEGLPIHFETNISLYDLIQLYNRATIYWHATGYGEDVIAHPERTEHFGISIVEAMSAGCIPVVFNAGGAPEILGHEQFGMLWVTKEELVTKTNYLIHNLQKQEALSQQAVLRANDFRQDIFHKHLDALIESK